MKTADSFASNGLALAKSGGKYGHINAEGEWVIKPAFENVGSFASNGLAPAKSGGKYGYINTEGEWVIKPAFEAADNFASNGLALALSGGKIKSFDKTATFRTHLGYVSEDIPDALHWRNEGGIRYLYNYNQDEEPVLYIESVCDTEVAKNDLDEIIWPEKSIAQICEDKSAQTRYQQEKDAQFQAALAAKQSEYLAAAEAQSE